uniref:Cysteine proteinase inhibitor n=1 Tax=Picea sitchensis TaxID=3332 RepID=A9NL68_PICSI|nr:unknown [Picea sitchensis]ABK22996.1 unknown [Picea sitchensis]ACN40467.1 unknown [Picea sitchensis]
MCMKMSMKMPMRCSRTMAVLILLLGCLCMLSDASTRIGGIRDIPDVEHKKEIQDLGRFAVDEYNTQQNVGISFSKVVKAQEQVVSGLLYYLTIKTKEGSKTKLYAAKIWVKPWEKFKQLQEFKPVQTLHK